MTKSALLSKNIVTVEMVEDEESPPDPEVQINENMSSPPSTTTTEPDVPTTTNCSSCSICALSFPTNRDRVVMEGLCEEGWKSLIFKALCTQLHLDEFHGQASINTDNLVATMKVFRLCGECVEYGWKLVELEQMLFKVQQEIIMLADSFRRVIITANPEHRNNDKSSLDKESGEDSNNSVGTDDEDGVGLSCINQFKKLVTQSVPLNVPDFVECSVPYEAPPDSHVQEPDADDDDSDVQILDAVMLDSIGMMTDDANGLANSVISLDENNDHTNADNDNYTEYANENSRYQSQGAISPSPPYSPLSPLHKDAFFGDIFEGGTEDNSNVELEDYMAGKESDLDKVNQDNVDGDETETETETETEDDDDMFMVKENGHSTVHISQVQPPILSPLSPPPSVSPPPPELPVVAEKRKNGRGHPKKVHSLQPLKELKAKRIVKARKHNYKKKITLANGRRVPTTTTKQKQGQLVATTKKNRPIRLTKKRLALVRPIDVEGYTKMTEMGIEFKELQIKVPQIDIEQLVRQGTAVYADSGKSKHLAVIPNSVYYDDLFNIKIESRARTPSSPNKKNKSHLNEGPPDHANDLFLIKYNNAEDGETDAKEGIIECHIEEETEVETDHHIQFTQTEDDSGQLLYGTEIIPDSQQPELPNPTYQNLINIIVPSDLQIEPPLSPAITSVCSPPSLDRVDDDITIAEKSPSSSGQESNYEDSNSPSPPCLVPYYQAGSTSQCIYNPIVQT